MLFNLQHCLVVATRYEEHTNSLTCYSKNVSTCIYSDSQRSQWSLQYTYCKLLPMFCTNASYKPTSRTLHSTILLC